MAISNPTIVIVPGAWHPRTAYSSLATQLQKASFPTLVVSLPSFNASEPLTSSCSADAKSVRQQILPLIEQDGKDIILLAHSYGGIPGGGAAYGLSQKTRSQQGKKGGVIGLVYMSAFVVPGGESLRDYLGGEHAPYVMANQPSHGLSQCADAIKTLFNDVASPLADSLASSLLPHALRAFESDAPPAAWAEPAFAGKIAFMKCTLDQALPPFVQDMFVQRSGASWIVRDVEAGHSPFASRPEEVVGVLKDLVGELGRD